MKIVRNAVQNSFDPEHAEQVARLAVLLFDELSSLHKMNSQYRELLELAALLHDIGYSDEDSKIHHKVSRDMILEMEIPGLVRHDLALCAQIARFHRKAEPDAERHKKFGQLSESDRICVEWLAGILRVADGLDRSHLSLVVGLACEVRPEALRIKLDCSDRCRFEIQAAREKGGLLERITGRKLMIKS
jgi:exopolyphosphatase/pppGpp-phosphohydrolase